MLRRFETPFDGKTILAGDGTPYRLVIHPSRSKLALMLLGSAAFVAVCIWIATPGVASRYPPWLISVVSYAGVLFFGFSGLSWCVRLLGRRPALEMDERGITDSASMLSIGHLAWDEIAFVAPYSLRSQKFLGIEPKDLDAVLERQNVVKRWLIKMGLAMGWAPVNIPEAVLPMDIEELIELLRTRYGVRVEGQA